MVGSGSLRHQIQLNEESNFFSVELGERIWRIFDSVLGNWEQRVESPLPVLASFPRFYSVAKENSFINFWQRRFLGKSFSRSRPDFHSLSSFTASDEEFPLPQQRQNEKIFCKSVCRYSTGWDEVFCVSSRKWKSFFIQVSQFSRQKETQTKDFDCIVRFYDVWKWKLKSRKLCELWGFSWEKGKNVQKLILFNWGDRNTEKLKRIPKD